MKTVYIVRHGETEGNIGKVYQGPETSLNDLGREQARTVAQRCKKLSFDALIASSTARSQETAEIIARETGHAIEISPLFDERRRPSRNIDKSPWDPEAFLLEAAWTLSLVDEGPKAEDGETFHELKARVIEALASLESHPSDSILLVGHGSYLKVLLAVIILGPDHTGAEFKKLNLAMQTDNTGITIITNNGKAEHTKWCVRVFNDRSHLGD